MEISIHIRSKADAAQFLSTFSEFTHNDFVEGSFWFRDDGPTHLFKSHEYTINHETKGIIGTTKAEAVDYVYRNRKRLNHADPTMVNATYKENRA